MHSPFAKSMVSVTSHDVHQVSPKQLRVNPLENDLESKSWGIIPFKLKPPSLDQQTDLQYMVASWERLISRDQAQQLSQWVKMIFNGRSLSVVQSSRSVQVP